MRIRVYCFEDKKWFESIALVSKYYGGRDIAKIRKVLNKPNLTAFGKHWCDESGFKDFNPLPIKNKKIRIFCVEDNKYFDSIREAKKYYGVKGNGVINKVVDNPNLTVHGKHFVKREIELA